MKVTGFILDTVTQSDIVRENQSYLPHLGLRSFLSTIPEANRIAQRSPYQPHSLYLNPTLPSKERTDTLISCRLITNFFCTIVKPIHHLFVSLFLFLHCLIKWLFFQRSYLWSEHSIGTFRLMDCLDSKVKISSQSISSELDL